MAIIGPIAAAIISALVALGPVAAPVVAAATAAGPVAVVGTAVGAPAAAGSAAGGSAAVAGTAGAINGDPHARLGVENGWNDATNKAKQDLANLINSLHIPGVPPVVVN